VALHHHIVEYSMPIDALINKTRFLRVLKPQATGFIVTHGHRHFDWIGACGHLQIGAAPPPVMGRPDEPSHSYVHSLAPAPNGSIPALAPERIDVGAKTSS
jgi:hypothetical protein